MVDASTCIALAAITIFVGTAARSMETGIDDSLHTNTHTTGLASFG
jgi:hypothetical protein